MKFSVSRESILKPLQLVSGVVERRQTMAVLGNVLVTLAGDELSLVGTDLEVEIIGKIKLDKDFGEGEITVPAKKFLDICKSLPDDSEIKFELNDQKLVLKSGRSRFTLTTLPSTEFPSVAVGENEFSFSCEQKRVKRLIEKTGFAMAQQDVRYYLNGMLWELKENTLRVVATDGHRLAMSSAELATDSGKVIQAILPRKGVIELSRLMGDGEEEVELILGSNHIRATTKDFVFTSKLVDGKFPDYERVVPKGGDKTVVADKKPLRDALSRTAILSNEKYRGVRLNLEQGLLRIMANNPDQEEAEDIVEVDYTGSDLEVGFNVNYLLDVTGVIEGEQLRMTLADSNSSALIEERDSGESAYVVMPMRL